MVCFWVVAGREDRTAPGIDNLEDAAQMVLLHVVELAGDCGAGDAEYAAVQVGVGGMLRASVAGEALLIVTEEVAFGGFPTVAVRAVVQRHCGPVVVVFYRRPRMTESWEQ